jgi:hypothetical protein
VIRRADDIDCLPVGAKLPRASEAFGKLAAKDPVRGAQEAPRGVARPPLAKAFGCKRFVRIKALGAILLFRFE